MLDDIPNTQYISDLIVNYVDKIKMTGKERQTLYELLHKFEGLGWSPGLFGQAHSETDSQMMIDTDKHKIFYEIANPRDDIIKLLTRYIEFHTPQN